MTCGTDIVSVGPRDDSALERIVPMLLADVPPEPVPRSPWVWIALALIVLAAFMIHVVMRPLRGWRRFAARHRLSFVGDTMQGEVGMKPVTITLDRTASAPKTRVKVGEVERETVGRASEAWLERALAEAASSPPSTPPSGPT